MNYFNNIASYSEPFLLTFILAVILFPALSTISMVLSSLSLSKTTRAVLKSAHVAIPEVKSLQSITALAPSVVDQESKLKVGAVESIIITSLSAVVLPKKLTASTYILNIPSLKVIFSPDLITILGLHLIPVE